MSFTRKVNITCAVIGEARAILVLKGFDQVGW